jgi:hypothetical protein
MTLSELVVNSHIRFTQIRLYEDRQVLLDYRKYLIRMKFLRLAAQMKTFSFGLVKMYHQLQQTPINAARKRPHSVRVICFKRPDQCFG